MHLAVKPAGAAKAVAGRGVRAVLGAALMATAVGFGVLAGSGFDTRFAKQTISCGAPVAESWPEQRPAGPSVDEAEYIVRTGAFDALAKYEADVVGYLEAKACGSTARSRLWRLGAGAVGAWTVGGLMLRSAFRRGPAINRRIAELRRA